MYWNDWDKIAEENDFTININMRCIEIRLVAEAFIDNPWLTLTWDVLKY